MPQRDPNTRINSRQFSNTYPGPIHKKKLTSLFQATSSSSARGVSTVVPFLVSSDPPELYEFFFFEAAANLEWIFHSFLLENHGLRLRDSLQFKQV